jgi:hypothetical protein
VLAKGAAGAALAAGTVLAAGAAGAAFAAGAAENVSFLFVERVEKLLTCCWSCGGGGSHLDRNTASEGSGTSGVLATNHADVALACDRSCTCLAGGNCCSEGKVLHLGVPVTSTVVARKVLSDSDWLPVCASSCGVDHALVRASTVTVDLVNGHHDLHKISK